MLPLPDPPTPQFLSHQINFRTLLRYPVCICMCVCECVCVCGGGGGGGMCVCMWISTYMCVTKLRMHGHVITHVSRKNYLRVYTCDYFKEEA